MSVKRRIESLEARAKHGARVAGGVAIRDMQDAALHAIHQRHASVPLRPCQCVKCCKPSRKIEAGASADEIVRNLQNRAIDRTCHADEYREAIEAAKPCTCPVCERRIEDGLPQLVVTDYDRAACR